MEVGTTTEARAPKRHRDAGLTIVELLVSLTIASVVASSTFVFFAGQQRVYDTQRKILNVQQNLWPAMETLSRYVRAAGSGMFGCVRADSDGPGPDTGDPPPASGAPPATGLRVFRGGAVIRIAPLWIVNGANGAPDTIAVAFGDGSFGNFNDTILGATIPPETPTAPIKTAAGL